MDALQNLFGVENNRVLIRKYKITGLGFKYVGWYHTKERGRAVDVRFSKYPHVPDDTNTYEIIDSFTLKKYFIHLLEKPVDDVTWLRIKQPGTYTIHFDLITDSFSFELHTRDEIIHFSEHNPKHNINLEKDEKCLLVWKKNPVDYYKRFKNICLL